MNRNDKMNEARDRTATPGRYRGWMGFGIGVVFLVMIAGFGSYVAALMNTLEDQNDFLNELRDRVEGNRKLLDVIESRGLRVVSLSSPDKGSSIYGTVFWNGESMKGMLVVSGVAPAGEDMVYRIWTIHRGQPGEVGSFTPGDRDPTYIPLDKVDARKPGDEIFLVTLEQETGTGKPAGAMILVGASAK